MHRGDSVDELLELDVVLGRAGVLDGALDVVDHGQQVGYQALGGALPLGQALGRRAAPEVLPVGLEAQHAVRGVGGLPLCGLDLVLHVGEPLLQLVSLLAELAGVRGELALGRLLAGADRGLHAGALLGVVVGSGLGRGLRTLVSGRGLRGLDLVGLQGLVLLVLYLDGHFHVTLLDSSDDEEGSSPFISGGGREAVAAPDSKAVLRGLRTSCSCRRPRPRSRRPRRRRSRPARRPRRRRRPRRWWSRRSARASGRPR